LEIAVPQIHKAETLANAEKTDGKMPHDDVTALCFLTFRSSLT
jgi:hypothetical protein